MKILVTGANGFIGRHCCALLKSQGHDVVALTSTEIDITKPFTLKGHFNAVLHLAAYNITSVGDKNEDAYARVNVQGTNHVLEAVSCDQFILLSTAKICSRDQSGYTQSKVAAEEMCQTHFKGKSLIIVRSVNILGKGQAPKAVLPIFIDKAKANQPLELTVHPLNPISFIDVRDVAALICAIVRRSDVSGTYNAAYPSYITLQDLALKVIAACHSSSKIRNMSLPIAPIGNPKKLDCQKTWEDFKYQPQFGIDQILENILL